MITYDLNSEGQKYKEVIQTIKDNSKNQYWCSYWKSSFLVKSDLSPDQFTDKLKPYLDNNDKLFIVEVKGNYQGWLTDKQWKYINNTIFDKGEK